MWKAIHEPSFVYIGVSAILTSLELQNPSKPMEVMRIDKYLPLELEVFRLTQTDELDHKCVSVIFRLLV